MLPGVAVGDMSRRKSFLEEMRRFFYEGEKLFPKSEYWNDGHAALQYTMGG